LGLQANNRRDLHLTAVAKASSVPGRTQTAVLASSGAANPDVQALKEWVISFSPVLAGRVCLPYEAGKIIVGRIWYRDIFKKHHSVGFVLKTDDLSAVGGRTASDYWKERLEKGLGPAEPTS
jgi:hypothetical protein